MKLIVILAGLFAVVAVAHAYSTNMLEALLQAQPAELEQEEPSMERYRHGHGHGHGHGHYEEVCHNYFIAGRQWKWLLH